MANSTRSLRRRSNLCGTVSGMSRRRAPWSDTSPRGSVACRSRIPGSHAHGLRSKQTGFLPATGAGGPKLGSAQFPICIPPATSSSARATPILLLHLFSRACRRIAASAGTMAFRARAGYFRARNSNVWPAWVSNSTTPLSSGVNGWVAPSAPTTSIPGQGLSKRRRPPAVDSTTTGPTFPFSARRRDEESALGPQVAGNGPACPAARPETPAPRRRRSAAAAR